MINVKDYISVNKSMNDISIEGLLHILTVLLFSIRYRGFGCLQLVQGLGDSLPQPQQDQNGE